MYPQYKRGTKRLRDVLFPQPKDWAILKLKLFLLSVSQYFMAGEH